MNASAEVAIRVSGLAKRFGQVVALDGVDFEVDAGTIFALLGPNGAGKTTAIRILATILRPDAGRAEVLGHDVVGDPRSVRFQIGLAGQNAAVDPNLTGRENLRLIGRLAQLPGRVASARADELLDVFDLVGAADRTVKTYSGGMRRRLDVAAALVQRPPVLFLDEPTTGLDIQSRTDLWQVIRELVADGATILLTTQYLEEADRLADRIAVVDLGRVIANDTPAALKARMGATVVEFTLSSAEAATQARARIAAAGIDHVELEGTSLRVTSDGAPTVIMELLRVLDGDGIRPTGLTVREPSLDDVFLSLTGRHAVPDGGEP
ncbi:daunorubicin resistance protein DrrA family ABC transporter ATP-binding protein [Longispora fulva]|uniref:Daunorubicin resistance ABC transporter ATP-binding subunit n=1 Tax=Longispora fulva TaxID=619741 RepID=A0A8J7GHE3_9ACTN|nr:ATP-binding cassette domain-containing protein [Longispora fulva]MBG6136687.1 daunorubicin resistance ABC transporter ATP-binding subunit [Longispora fulva]GIG59856.1 daunorubicin resistance protein DrrA family ABC transporter ATP-binding protein [Longispora fulva]